jgi:hypothetical protein
MSIAMDAPKSRAEMVGEAFREVGILATVFIPLDYVFADQPALPWWGVLLAMLVYGVGVWCAGVVIEERRQ